MFIGFGGYSAGIVDEMKQLGADVVFMPDKPNEGFICKSMGRYRVKAYVPVLENYYHQKLSELKHNRFDYILIIKGEYTPEKSLAEMRKYFPQAKMILYMWDSILNNKGVEKKWKYFDKCLTFDRIDYLAHQDQLLFRPLFYYEKYLPKNADTYQYDISFIGTGHGDRVKIVHSVEQQCKELGLSFYSYLFLPHKLVYFYNKVLNLDYKEVHMDELHFKMLPFTTTYSIYGGSKCVIDVESKTQCGLTMRTIEMVGLKKKLITTNKDIVNYDIYNTNNIMVVDRENFQIDSSFFEREYEDLPDQIYQKYSLKNWILEVLS